MTLYEEAGLTRNASADEIRQAYHNFVRLLHPDAVHDPALQPLAEAQLRRINSVFEVLNDPRRRADYDLTLEHRWLPLAPLTPVTNRPTTSTPSLWGILLVAGLSVLFWASGKPSTQAASPTQMQPLEPTQPATPATTPADTAPRLTADVAQELRQLRRELAAVRNEQQGVEQTADEQPESSEASTETESDPIALSNLAPISAPARLATPSAPAAKATGTPTIYGTWLYAQKAASTIKKDWYPPDYVELKIQPANGGIAGRFQARYRVGDRPISPEVHFYFEGKGDVLSWSGANGATGELRLKQTSPMTLQVDWTTTKPGTLPQLMAGSSVLVKSPQ